MTENYAFISSIEEIKKFGTWCHGLDSTWIVKTNLEASQIYDRLYLKIDNNDKLIVIRLKREAAWIGFNKQCSDWLKENLSDE